MHFLSILLLLPALLIGACSSTTIHTTWKTEDTILPTRHIMILGVSKNQAAVKLFESEVATQLQKIGIKAIPGFSVIADRENVTKNEIVKIAHENNVDSVMIAIVLDSREETELKTTVQSDAGRSYSGYYRGARRDWYNNYASGYTTVTSQTNKYTIADVETSLYRLETEKMVWSAVSETVSLNTGSSDIKNLATEITSQLKKDGIL